GSCNELSPRERAPSFMQMDGRSLGFVDDIFDAVREDRALQHIAHPELVLHELIRVLKPGGRFVLFEPDWELFIIANSAHNLTRSILNYWADQFMNGWIGRELYQICTNAGVCEVSVLPRTMILHDLQICDRIFGIRETVSRACDTGVIAKNEGSRWLDELEGADRKGTFFSSFTGYLITGKNDEVCNALAFPLFRKLPCISMVWWFVWDPMIKLMLIPSITV
ncbi:MAG: methyltransferase domain-containing protein, partial [Methanospirillum sp.]|uniref:methyltransferase domain-containing protein n=1 Tax=Methanospirillum sp. TaxID=45200 RepID=UPI002371A7A5